MLTEKDGWDQGLDPTTQYVRTQEELIPFDDTNQLLPTHEGIINLDINDRNVMLSDVAAEDLLDEVDDSEHSHKEVPVFKIGDLGVVRAFRGHHRDSMLALASTRVLGNHWCHTPEQFTQTWNYYGATASDIDALNADDTAGKYDWWTNLWQVARLMMIMVSKAHHIYSNTVVNFKKGYQTIPIVYRGKPSWVGHIPSIVSQTSNMIHFQITEVPLCSYQWFIISYNNLQLGIGCVDVAFNLHLQWHYTVIETQLILALQDHPIPA